MMGVADNSFCIITSWGFEGVVDKGRTGLSSPKQKRAVAERAQLMVILLQKVGCCWRQHWPDVLRG
jgi:hypothetical protein